MDTDADKFTSNLDELVAHFECQKGKLKLFLKKNFLDGKHYVVKPSIQKTKTNGGQNRQTILLTEECFNLTKASYQLKNNFTPLIQTASGTLKQVQILMSLENQTIGFIASCLHGIVPFERQMRIGRYHVDLCFPDHSLILECDEMDHVDRDADAERTRQQFLEGEGYELIRFNPNADDFDISIIIRQVLLRTVKC